MELFWCLEAARPSRTVPVAGNGSGNVVEILGNLITNPTSQRLDIQLGAGQFATPNDSQGNGPPCAILTTCAPIFNVPLAKTKWKIQVENPSHTFVCIDRDSKNHSFFKIGTERANQISPGQWATQNDCLGNGLPYAILLTCAPISNASS